jgi:hypothetical protein
MAPPFDMIVAIVGIGCTAGVIHKALDVMAIRKRSGADSQSVKAELSALRQEIAALRTWANDLILSFDSTLHRQDARLQSLERRALAESGTAAHTGVLAGEARAEPEALEVRPRT